MKQLYRIIAHLDMDAFFAAIEERNNPQFAGLPIAVGADPKDGTGRGVVSTANYKARLYGIHSALPISTAWKLSEQAKKKGESAVIFLPPNFSQYHQISQRIYVLLKGFVPVVEAGSIDEFYLDLSFCSDFLKATRLIQEIKAKIKGTERLTCSVGVSTNKLVAKIASAHQKPDGLTMVPPEKIETFLGHLVIGKIPGIGPKTEEVFHKRNIRTVSVLQKIGKEVLLTWFGKWGEDIYNKVRGIDAGEVTEEQEIKSISLEETFEVDTLNPSYLFERLLFLTTNICPRVRNEKITGFKTISVKIRFSDFTTKTRSHTLDSYTDNLTVLQTEVKRLFLPFLDKRENPQKKAIRLVGVKVDNWQKSVL